MNITEGIVDRLLFEEEGDTVDFKSKQYPFERANNDEKSELLKDILAFTNAWRRSDAYILIGIEEARGGRSKVLGVTNHLDDAKLQQFVNSKTNTPIQFSYHPLSFEDCEIGIINIPLQHRPVFLKKSFGKLEKDKVYIRRGSSTDIAAPDEIAKMGESSTFDIMSIPNLEVCFFDSENLRKQGQELEIETVNIILPPSSEIPDYGAGRYTVVLNKDYYRDLAKYLEAQVKYSEINLCISNNGTVVANDVRLIAEIEDPSYKYLLADSGDIPCKPYSEMLLSREINALGIGGDIEVQRTKTSWFISAELGKIQPKGSSNTSSGLFIGAKDSTELILRFEIYADNLPAPKTQELEVKIQAKSKNLSVDDLLKLSDGVQP